IEAVLATCPGVQAACVVPWTMASGQAELAAYYTGTDSEETALRRHLAARLPPYLIPSRFVHLPQFPLTSTGKLNRRPFPPPGLQLPNNSASAQAPPTATEARVLHAFAAALEKPNISADADFFTLGGHSLRAVQLAALLEKEFSIEVPLLTIFQRPTV